MVTHNIEEAVTMGDRLIVMGANPGCIRIELPGLPVEQRGKENQEHLRLVDYVYGVMTRPTEEIEQYVSAAHRKVHERRRSFQTLPHVAVGQVTGLVERLHADGDREDLYVLGSELHMEVDDLLPLIQAIDMLNLGNIESGDVLLSPAGVQFAEAGVLEEKDVFRQQAIDHIQLIRYILKALKSSQNNRVRWDTIHKELQQYFSEDEAERQLDTAVDWGRYAEVFAYDDQDGVFYLENDISLPAEPG